MRPTFYLSTIVIKSIDSMFLKDESYMAPRHLVRHCKDDLVKDNIGGHLSLSKQKRKKKKMNIIIVHWCAMFVHHLLPCLSVHGGAHHSHDDLAHPTPNSQITCHVMQVSKKEKSLIKRMELSLEITEL